MPAYEAELERFEGHDTQVVGISTDSTFSHIAWQQKSIGMLHFPLCSDFWPHGEISRAYDVFRTGDPIPGINNRSVFIVDKAGKIVFSQVYELGEQPDNEEAFAALQKL